MSISSLPMLDMVLYGHIAVVEEVGCDMANDEHNDCVRLINMIKVEDVMDSNCYRDTQVSDRGHERRKIEKILIKLICSSVLFLFFLKFTPLQVIVISGKASLS